MNVCVAARAIAHYVMGKIVFAGIAGGMFGTIGFVQTTSTVSR